MGVSGYEDLAIVSLGDRDGFPRPILVNIARNGIFGGTLRATSLRDVEIRALGGDVDV